MIKDYQLMRWTGANSYRSARPVHAVTDLRRPVDGCQGDVQDRADRHDDGEVIVYAPHITESSCTHGKLIDEVGSHMRGYFVGQ